LKMREPLEADLVCRYVRKDCYSAALHGILDHLL
jgi:hypothetical protein